MIPSTFAFVLCVVNLLAGVAIGYWFRRIIGPGKRER